MDESQVLCMVRHKAFLPHVDSHGLRCGRLIQAIELSGSTRAAQFGAPPQMRYGTLNIVIGLDILFN